MKLNSKIIAVILVTVLFGGIGITKVLGVWQTESTKIPAKYIDGEFAGQYNPEDIRGSYALQDITNAFDIPVETLAKAFGIRTGDPASALVKDLEPLYAYLKEEGTPIETASIRYFVALYKGLPFEEVEEIYLPLSAVEILQEKGNLTPEQQAYLENHTVEIKSDALGVINSSEERENTEGKSSLESSEGEDRIVKGNSTFKEVLDWGVPKLEVEEIIGGKIPSTGLTIRDYCTQQGIEFSTVKGALQERIDAGGIAQ